MIHKLLALSRPLFVFDTETTGLNVLEDRIVEIGFQEWTAEGMVKEWRTLVNPGIPIPPVTTETHGITDAALQGCQKCGKSIAHPNHDPAAQDQKIGESVDWEDSHPYKPVPTFRQLATNLAKGFSNCDFAGKNIRFDLRMLAAEMNRAGVEWGYGGARIIDADRLEQLGEPRTLSHLYKKHLGKNLEDAHQALADVRGTTELIVAQLRAYPTLPRNLDVLHAAQWPGWIDPEGKFKFVDGVACVGSWGKWAGKPMKSVDPGYWDFILKSDFSVDVKALAREAKLGKFPTP